MMQIIYFSKTENCYEGCKSFYNMCLYQDYYAHFVHTLCLYVGFFFFFQYN
uniref:Uncharacterized protein n=1 Tax=Rhizophora mucronata TaxID=61149 RepID=A0A2P2P7C0_RHIMU